MESLFYYRLNEKEDQDKEAEELAWDYKYNGSAVMASEQSN